MGTSNSTVNSADDADTFVLSMAELKNGCLITIEILVCIWLAFYAYNYIYNGVMLGRNFQRMLQKWHERDTKNFVIPHVSEEKTEKILKAKGVQDLVQMQIDGIVSSVEIVAVYSKRAHSIGR